MLSEAREEKTRKNNWDNTCGPSDDPDYVAVEITALIFNCNHHKDHNSLPMSPSLRKLLVSPLIALGIPIDTLSESGIPMSASCNSSFSHSGGSLLLDEEHSYRRFLQVCSPVESAGPTDLVTDKRARLQRNRELEPGSDVHCTLGRG